MRVALSSAELRGAPAAKPCRRGECHARVVLLLVSGYCLHERDADECRHGLDLVWFSGEVGVPDEARRPLVERLGDVDRQLEWFLTNLLLTGVEVGVVNNRARVGYRHRWWWWWWWCRFGWLGLG